METLGAYSMNEDFLQSEQNDATELEQFIFKKVDNDDLGRSILEALAENGIDLFLLNLIDITTMQDFKLNMKSLEDMELVGIEQREARLLLGYNVEEQVVSNLEAFIQSKVKDQEAAASLLETLKDLGKYHYIALTILEIEDLDSFQKDIQTFEQMITVCLVTEDIASLFFEKEAHIEESLSEQEISAMFPISGQYVFSKLSQLSLSNLDQVKNQAPEFFQQSNLKEYQIIKLYKKEPEFNEANQLINIIKQIVEDQKTQETVFQKMKSEGALLFSVFDECSDDELKAFGLKLIQIRKIRGKLQPMQKQSNQINLLKSSLRESSTPLFQQDNNEEEKSAGRNKQSTNSNQNCDGDYSTPFTTQDLEPQSQTYLMTQNHNQISQSDQLTQETDQSSHRSNLKLIEEIDSLIQDYQDMPHCFIKVLINLLQIISSIVHQPENEDLNPEDYVEQIMETFEELRKLKNEDSEDYDIQLRELHTSLISQSWKTALKHIMCLVKTAMPLNLKYLFRLIQNVEKSAQLLKGQDVILLLGGTGVGKSTFIHFLAGSKFKKVEKSGLLHLDPYIVKNNALKNVICSPYAVSETRYITPVPINLMEMGLDEDKDIVLCDSPGFDDTAGQEVDIANSIGIIKAVKECKTVRPVILSSYMSIGDRGQGIKRIAKIITGMIPSVSDHINSFSYYFSKCPPDRKKMMNQFLADIKKNLTPEDKSDASFVQLLSSMIRKTREAVKAVEPETDDAINYLEDLIGVQCIKYPHEVFQQYISELSRGALNDQMNLIKLRIRKYLETYQFDLIKYYLDQLKTLQESINMVSIDHIYADLVSLVRNSVSKKFESVTSQFNKCFQENNALSEEDIFSFQLEIEKFQQLRQLRLDHLGEECMNPSALADNLTTQLRSLFESIKSEDSILQPQAYQNLKKIKLVVSKIPGYDQIYDDLKAILLDIFYKKIQEIKGQIDEFKIEVFVMSTNELKRIMQNIQQSIPQDILEDNFAQLLGYFIKILEKEESKIESQLKQQDINDEGHKIIRDSFKKLRQARDCHEISKFYPNEDIQAIYERTTSMLINRCCLLSQNVFDFCKDEEKIENIEALMDQFEKFREIEEIQQMSSQIFYNCLGHLSTFILNLKSNLDTFLAKLIRKDKNIHFMGLKKLINILEKAKWIKKFQPQIYSETLGHVKQLLVSTLNDYKENLDQTVLDIDHPLNIQPCQQLTQQIKQIMSLFKVCPELAFETDIEEIPPDLKLKEKINSVLKYIADQFQIQEQEKKQFKNLDFILLEKSLKFSLEATTTNNYFDREKYGSLNQVLQSLILSYQLFQKQFLEEAFQEILGYVEDLNNEETIQNIQKNRINIISQIIQDLMNMDKYQLVLKIYTEDLQEKNLKFSKNQLNNVLNELQNKMEAFTISQNYHQVEKTFFVARIMSQLDEFMQGGTTFQSIFQNSQKDLYKDGSKLYLDTMENIDKRNYIEVSDQISNLESAKNSYHYGQKARQYIFTSLQQRLDYTLSKVKQRSNITEEKLEVYIGNIKDLDTALFHLEIKDEYKTILIKKKDDILQFIGKRMKELLDSINSLIETRCFGQVNVELESIDTLVNIMDNYCSEDILDKMEQLGKAQKDQIKKVIDEFEKVAREVKVLEYQKLKPIFLFKQLESAIYLNDRLLIESTIRETYQKEVEQIKLQEKELQATFKRLEKIQNTLKYLPASIIDEISDTLKDCEDNLKYDQQQKEKQVSDLIENGQLEDIASLLKEGNIQDQQQLQKFKEFIKKKMQDFHDILKNLIQSSKTVEIFPIILSIQQFKEQFSFKFLTEINSEYNQVQMTIIEEMKKVQRAASKVFILTDINSLALSDIELNDSYESNTSTFELISQIGQSLKQESMSIKKQQTPRISVKQFDGAEALKILIVFFELKEQKESQKAINEMLPSVEKELKVLLQKIVLNINKEIQNFNKCLETMKVIPLKSILKNLRQWNKLFKNCMDDINLQDLKQEHLRILQERLSDNSIRQLQRSLEQKVIQAYEQFIDDIQKRKPKLRKEMDEFYQMLNTNFNLIKNIDKLQAFAIDSDFVSFKKDCIKLLDDRIEQFRSISEAILSHEHLSKEDCFNLGYSLNNLSSMYENVDYGKSQVATFKHIQEQKLSEKINKIFEIAKAETSPEQITNNLIELKLLCDNITPMKEQINQKIEDILKIQTKKNKKNFVKIGILLECNPIGKIIISEYKSFAGVQNQLFNSKSRRHTIETVLENIEGDEIMKDSLKTRYEEFDKQYKEIIKWYIQPKNYPEIQNIATDTKLKSGGITQFESESKWGLDILNKIPEISAHVFALYTLQNASQFIESDGNDSKDFLFTPHPAQVISIFRLLGLGYQKNFSEKVKSKFIDTGKLKNNLIQIGTGEGKSVTLAVASCVLALFGFDVYCACYSSYLSKRDYDNFTQLFDAFNISSKIHYGTFNQTCENILNGKFDIRSRVKDYINTGTFKSSEYLARKECLKVLLIDEVDVFLNKEFYGNIYSPCLKLQHPLIKEFTDFIWSFRANKQVIDLNKVTTSKEYKNLIANYSGWDTLILELTKEMILCLTNFESHTYVVNDRENKIGYQMLDSVAYNAVQSYNTLFAYYFESLEKKSITDSSLDENIFLQIRCGEFSYAEVPKQFAHIMGVTGTLKTLTDVENKIIEQYNLNKRTFVPSVFGKNNLKFKEDDIFVENKDDYFNVIRREIYNKLNPDPENNIQRAVLVFFESIAKLKEFLDSPEYDLKDITNYLTEKADPNEKDSLIKNATNVGQITFLTRAFGRGTDFVVRDEVILNNGGIHVIQTFLSEELSEEVQIKGRTARQGTIGSYSMVLLDKSLELFGIKDEDIEKNKGNLMKLLNDKRNHYQLKQQTNNLEYIEKVKEQHMNSTKFISNLEKGNVKEIKSYLTLLNKGPQIQVQQTRTLCLIDATGSMGSLLSKVKTTVEDMFKRASQTLVDSGYNPDCFLIKFVVYRNYGQKENEILVASGWESSPTQLREFIQNVRAFGGSSPGEAAEVGFQYASLEQNDLKAKGFQIDQILLIGDAPSNTASETINHRNSNYGENYWKTTKFSTPGNIEQLVSNLKAQQIITNTFYLNDYAKNSFQRIAALGGGKSEFLDINSSKGAETLTSFVTIEILRKVGSQGGSIENGEKLVEAYKTKYLSYTS